jgi:hypothetical protein
MVVNNSSWGSSPSLKYCCKHCLRTFKVTHKMKTKIDAMGAKRSTHSRHYALIFMFILMARAFSALIVVQASCLQITVAGAKLVSIRIAISTLDLIFGINCSPDIISLQFALSMWDVSKIITYGYQM